MTNPTYALGRIGILSGATITIAGQTYDLQAVGADLYNDVNPAESCIEYRFDTECPDVFGITVVVPVPADPFPGLAAAVWAQWSGKAEVHAGEEFGDGDEPDADSPPPGYCPII